LAGVGRLIVNKYKRFQSATRKIPVVRSFASPVTKRSSFEHNRTAKTNQESLFLCSGGSPWSFLQQF
jgi:hypothetical protein